MKAILYPAMTLDGFIANPKGECYQWISEEDEKGYTAAIAKAGCVLLGRKTYEQYIDDYPLKGGETVFVWTTRTDQADQDKIKFLRGTPEEIMQQIADHGFSEVVVSGGGEVNGSLAEAGLLDEIVISIYDVTLGEGIRLFGSHKPQLKLKLLSSKQEIAGITKNHYLVVNE